MRHRLLLAVFLLTAACQGPAPVSGPVASPVDVNQLRSRGDAHLALGEYGDAVTNYREALAVDSAHVPTRYRLAVALSRLGQSTEAGETFRWIVANATGDSEELRLSGQWVAEHDGPKKPVGAIVSASDPAATSGSGQVEGKTEWSGIDPGKPHPTLQILLQGDDSSTRGQRYFTKTPLGEPYRVEKMVPGRYRLTAQVGPIRLWDTGVTVGPSGSTSLNLTPAISSAPADALRPR